ncbi:MAG: YchJ family metal-binding protein [Desulfuromonadales bacterium]
MKTGRNDPCPCGSGLKYKKCCQNEVPDTGSGMTPVELVRARVRAFRDDDFAFIYDSYHSRSYFRKQFPDREAYVRQGRRSLADDYTINKCLIVKDHIDEDEAAVIFYLHVSFRGTRQESFELAFFYKENGEWRYHSSQKMSRQDYQGPVEELDWSDFEKINDKVFF